MVLIVLISLILHGAYHTVLQPKLAGKHHQRQLLQKRMSYYPPATPPDVFGSRY